MCMIDYSDGPCIMLYSKQRGARKQHKCEECYRVIMSGEQYLVETTLFEGRIDTVKTCAHCQVARDWLTDECRGFLFGRVQEDILEHCHEYEYPFSLWRVAAGMRRKWQTIHGALMPIPAMPPTSHQTFA